MNTHPGPRRRAAIAALLAAAVGCRGDEPEPAHADPDSIVLAPVSGVVRLNGTPLARAVVTFMPPTGATSVGETAGDGRYTLESYGRPGGAPAGHYKVAISYLASADGEPQGLKDRSGLAPNPKMNAAREVLPPAISDLGRTTLTADVPPAGGPIDFDLKADVTLPESKEVPPNP